MALKESAALRSAIGTLAHNRWFSARELSEHTRFDRPAIAARATYLVRRLVADWRLARTAKRGYYFPTAKGWAWIEGEHGDAMTPRRAHVIRASEDRFEKARETHDPKRYKRGGGYTPEEYKAIATRAGISRAPSNRAREALAVHEFMRDKPEHVFAYYSDDMRTVQLWSKKSTIGDISWRGAVQRRMGGKVQAIRVRGYNGVMYGGIANLSSGTYVRLRRLASSRVMGGR